MRILLAKMAATKAKHLIDEVDALNRTPLIVAVENGSEKCVEELVNNFADKNARDVDGRTALHIAILLRKRQIASFLADKGADITARDNKGRLPTDYAKDLAPRIKQIADTTEVFLSYAHSDKSITRKLKDEIEKYCLKW